MMTMVRVMLLAGAALIYAMADPAEASEPWYIYMYASEHDTPVRVLEIASDVDGLGQCEFFRDLLDKGLQDAHRTVFFTCVTDIDLAVWEES